MGIFCGIYHAVCYSIDIALVRTVSRSRSDHDAHIDAHLDQVTQQCP